MKRVIVGAVVIAVLTLSAVAIQSNTANAADHSFQLTVRNTTAQQPITPPVVVVHDANTVLLPSNADRLPGLEALAESGAQVDLIASLSDRTGVKSVSRFGGIIKPGDAATILNVEAESGDHVSVIAMLACTNDAITVATAILTDAGAPAFGSGVVLDAGTEDNDESRATVPCLEGEGVSAGDTADGEGIIAPHPGIVGNADLGAGYDWDGAVVQLIVDEPGTLTRAHMDVGISLQNNTNGQPITPPVVIVHDPNVNAISYTRPAELDGIDDLSEGGVNGDLIASLAGAPGVVSVSQWDTGGPIPPRSGHRGNVSAIDGTAITVVGMFACTNDAYIVASSNVIASGDSVHETSAVASVFDSGSENNDEAAATVPCLGGADAALSEGDGENERREHPGITGEGDLNPAIHAWRADATAELTVSGPYDESHIGPVPTALPSTGGTAPDANWSLLFGIVGLLGVVSGGSLVFVARRRR